MLLLCVFSCEDAVAWFAPLVNRSISAVGENGGLCVEPFLTHIATIMSIRVTKDVAAEDVGHCGRDQLEMEVKLREDRDHFQVEANRRGKGKRKGKGKEQRAKEESEKSMFSFCGEVNFQQYKRDWLPGCSDHPRSSSLFILRE